MSLSLRPHQALAAAGLLTSLLLAGCRGGASDGTWVSTQPGQYSVYGYDPHAPAATQASLPEDAVVEAGLEAAEARALARRQALEAQLGEAIPSDVREAAILVARCYGEGQRELAERVIESHPALYSWQDAQDVAFISCGFQPAEVTGGQLEINVVRTAPLSAGEIAVCFSPGTYAEALDVADAGASPLALSMGADLAEGELDNQLERALRESQGEADERAGGWTTPREDRSFEGWPAPPQDLAMLQAPVVVLPASDLAKAKVGVPISCASFERRTPDQSDRYQLAAFPRGSAVDKLMLALCAQPQHDDAEAQLATWIARSDLKVEEFFAQGGSWGRLRTFGTGQAVLPHHATGAADLLVDGQVDPRAARFFGGEGVEQAQTTWIQDEEVEETEPGQERAEPQQELELTPDGELPPAGEIG